jgi:hypothetical protein
MFCQPKGGPSFCLPQEYHQACDGTCREEIKYITSIEWQANNIINDLTSVTYLIFYRNQFLLPIAAG